MNAKHEADEDEHHEREGRLELGTGEHEIEAREAHRGAEGDERAETDQPVDEHGRPSLLAAVRHEAAHVVHLHQVARDGAGDHLVPEMADPGQAHRQQEGDLDPVATQKDPPAHPAHAEAGGAHEEDDDQGPWHGQGQLEDLWVEVP